MPGREKSALFYRVIWVVYRPRERIAEDGGRLLEGHVMFREILSGLLRIRLKSHGAKSTTVVCRRQSLSALF